MQNKPLRKRFGKKHNLAAYNRAAGKIYSGGWRPLSHEFLQENLSSSKKATVWCQTEVTALANSVEKHSTSAQWKEVIAVILDNTEKWTDVLEFQYQLLPTLPTYRSIGLMSQTLSNSWVNRLPGISAKRKSLRDVNDNGQGAILPTQILTHNNPHGLSRAEFRVCILVKNGMNVSDISSSLDVSASSVRKLNRPVFAGGSNS